MDETNASLASIRQRIAMKTLTKTLLLMSVLAPLLAAADPLDKYGNLTGKTILMPSALPFLSDAIISDLPTEKTDAIAKIESEFSKLGIALVQDGRILSAFSLRASAVS